MPMIRMRLQVLSVQGEMLPCYWAALLGHHLELPGDVKFELTCDHIFITVFVSSKPKVFVREIQSFVSILSTSYICPPVWSVSPLIAIGYTDLITRD